MCYKESSQFVSLWKIGGSYASLDASAEFIFKEYNNGVRYGITPLSSNSQETY